MVFSVCLFVPQSSVQVLPRQTCGLYTHTITYDKYPSGSSVLETSIAGGELFMTFVLNKVWIADSACTRICLQYLIFMTHQPNYTKDRLAIYTFEKVLHFLRCWTNLRLHSTTPVSMALKYFDDFPDERQPLWGVSVVVVKCVKMCINICRIRAPTPVIGKYGRRTKRAIDCRT
jgi:hypothetical protein